MNNVFVNQTPPKRRDPSTASLNNRLAWAYASADPRMAMKQYDRPGMSRGAAQRNQAGIDAAQSLASGIGEAYSRDIEGRIYDANAELQGRQGQEQFAQALGGLQQQQNYANQMAALQRQQTMLGLLGGLTQGLFD